MRVYQFRHVGLKAKPDKGCSTSDVPNNTCNTNCGQLKMGDFCCLATIFLLVHIPLQFVA
jgi:hypothetical protein